MSSGTIIELIVTAFREERFVSQTAIQHIKEDVAAFINKRVEATVTRVAAVTDCDPEQLKKHFAASGFHAFDELYGIKAEKSMADGIIHPVYPEPPRRVGDNMYVVDTKLEKTFGNLMRDPNNVKDVNRQHPDFDGVVRDVRDGSLWRNQRLYVF